MVRERRLELLYLAVPDPKSGASANFATLANEKRIVKISEIDVIRQEKTRNILDSGDIISGINIMNLTSYA